MPNWNTFGAYKPLPLLPLLWNLAVNWVYLFTIIKCAVQSMHFINGSTLGHVVFWNTNHMANHYANKCWPDDDLIFMVLKAKVLSIELLLSSLTQVAFDKSSTIRQKTNKIKNIMWLGVKPETVLYDNKLNIGRSWSILFGVASLPLMYDNDRKL